MSIIVFDTEATGLAQAQICQIAYLIADQGSVIGKNMYFSVDEMSEDAYRIHGMSREELDVLSGGVRFGDRAEEIMKDFASARLLAGHNVSADIRYLKQELSRLHMEPPKVGTFCTMNHFTKVTKLKRRYGTWPKPPRLEELAAYYELSPEFISQKADEWFGGGARAHDARYDAAATYLCMLAGTEKGDLTGIL